MWRGAGGMSFRGDETEGEGEGVVDAAVGEKAIEGVAGGGNDVEINLYRKQCFLPSAMRGQGFNQNVEKG